MATAVAGAILGINPFDQPDVEAAKIKTRELTAAFEKTGELPDEEPVVSTAEADIYTDAANADALRKASADGDLSSWLKAHLSRTEAGDYVALLAYIERDDAHIDSLQQARIRHSGPEKGRHLRRVRPALPAFNRAGLQRRPRQRDLPSDHRR